MNAFIKPQFVRGILGIAEAYGTYDFWLQQLRPGENPEGTWKALLLLGCLKDPRYSKFIDNQLDSNNSRVRAWSCFALGQLKNDIWLESIRGKLDDPSCRVRFHSRQAINSINGEEFNIRHFPSNSAQKDKTIIISTDSKFDQNFFSILFNKRGFNVEMASTAEETIAKAFQLQADLIITDNQKKKPNQADNLSGINMTWDISRNPNLSETIVIILTDDYIEPIFLWSGGDYYISKHTLRRGQVETIVEEYLLQ